MHAIRLHQFGPAENLRYEEVPDIHPLPGQARIAVAAAGVHVVDTTLRAGNYQRGPIPAPDLPTIPGREVAGTVDEVGPGVDRGWIGRPVVVHLGMVPGGYASQAVAATTSLHALPENVDPAEAVAMIGTGRTTMGILEVAALGPDDAVLVTGAAGGIGSLIVQVARNTSAFVVGIAGGDERAQLVKELGADLAVDHRLPGWPQQLREQLAGRALSVAFDGVGGTIGRAALELLSPGGRFIMYGWGVDSEPTQLTSGDLFTLGITAAAAVGPRVLQRPGGLRSLEDSALALLESGLVKPLVHRFALADAAVAHLAIEQRRTTGKVVLVP